MKERNFLIVQGFFLSLSFYFIVMFITVYLMLSYPVHPLLVHVLSPPYSLRVRYWLWNKQSLLRVLICISDRWILTPLALAAWACYWSRSFILERLVTQRLLRKSKMTVPLLDWTHTRVCADVVIVFN
jgi:hypothetical protein